MIHYWIVVLSKDTVLQGMKEGFTQSGNGKIVSLKRMTKGDKLVFYSPKQTLKGFERCQRFTALGTVADEDIYQKENTGDFKPFRRKVTFEKCSEIPLLPLIQKLSFIRSKSRWGELFRLDLLQIPEEDYKLISGLMHQEIFA